MKLSLFRYLLPILLTGIALVGNLAHAGGGEIRKIDRIIAIVDQVVITENELIDRIQTVRSQLEKQGATLPPRDVLQKQILERLINDRLLLQYAAQTGIRVDDTQLDKTVERIDRAEPAECGGFSCGAGTGRHQLPQVPRGYPQMKSPSPACVSGKSKTESTSPKQKSTTT